MHRYIYIHIYTYHISDIYIYTKHIQHYGLAGIMYTFVIICMHCQRKFVEKLRDTES